MPKANKIRDFAMIGIALRYGLDSIELEEVVRQAGLDPETASLEEIRKAVAGRYQQLPAPPFWPRW